jgi:lysophospholipase
MNSLRRAWPPGISPKMLEMRDGWQLRALDWPSGQVEPRGSILFQGGRGDIIEKYLETFSYWHAHGWSVLAFDWRGQGGSGRLLADPSIGHIDDFATWVGDLAQVFADWKADAPGPHIVMGHSMGGHLVLRALIEQVIAPDAAVLLAPMLGFDTGPLPVPVSSFLVRLAARIGLAEKHAWRVNERPSSPWASRQKMLTHDLSRYEDEIWWKSENPALPLGPPSVQWLVKAEESNALIMTDGAPEAMRCPVLVLGTDGDRLVSPAAIRSLVPRLPHGRLHMYGVEAAHEILREADPVRNDALARIDAFLGEVAPER